MVYKATELRQTWRGLPEQGFFGVWVGAATAVARDPLAVAWHIGGLGGFQVREIQAEEGGAEDPDGG